MFALDSLIYIFVTWESRCVMSLCGDKSCVPCAIKIQNYARHTEVEEVHTLPEMITTEARSISFLILLYWIWSINPELPKPANSRIYTCNISLVWINSKNSKFFVFFNLNLLWWAPFIDSKLPLNHKDVRLKYAWVSSRGERKYLFTHVDPCIWVSM